ncbi:MAG: 4Fe-4S dicluster domain-containing protein [Bacillota bacterium]
MLKRLGKKHDLCIGCASCEEVCAQSFFKETKKEKSSIHIRHVSDQAYSINVCNQCSVCIDICPVEALYRDKNGVVKIKKNICVGCFMCVGFCPEQAMRQHDAYIEPFKCIACGLCAKRCPTEAIFIEEVATETVEVTSMEETATARE